MSAPDDEYIFLIIKTVKGSHRINLDHVEDYYPVTVSSSQILLCSGRILDIPEPVEYLDELLMGYQSIVSDDEKNAAH